MPDWLSTHLNAAVTTLSSGYTEPSAGGVIVHRRLDRVHLERDQLHGLDAAGVVGRAVLTKWLPVEKPVSGAV